MATMLPVCSASPSCSSASLIPLHVGTRFGSPASKSIVEGRSFFSNCNGVKVPELSVKLEATNSIHFPSVEDLARPDSIDSSIFSNYPDEFDDIVRRFSDGNIDMDSERLSCAVGGINGTCSVNNGLLEFATSRGFEAERMPAGNMFLGDIANELDSGVIGETTIPDGEFQLPATGNEVLSFQESLDQTSSPPIDSSFSGPDSATSSLDSIIPDNSETLSSSIQAINNNIDNLKKSIEDLFSGFTQSLNTSVTEAQNFTANSYKSVNSSIKDALNDVTNSLLSSVGSTKEQTGGKLADLSGQFKDNLYKSSLLAVDILRGAIVSLENSFVNATSFVVCNYESAKILLPPEAKNVLDISEERITVILRPIGTAFQQVYVVIEGLERNIGLDPNDPIIPFVLLLGTSATFGASYWVFKYGGYSGDLSPNLALELLKNEGSTVLVDVRPEELREKEGIPDLRRGARFKYASVTVPEVDDSSKKALRSVKDVNDALFAVVIRNLKITHGGSKVIIMDNSGNRAKGIARSLRKLGVKRPYIMQGGFQSWVKDGLRVKQLKPETALTILNEEAEAILEDIKPTPALVFGYVIGFAAVIYSLSEWEKTLQLIGFVGLGQSLYRRVASYESSEDLKKDVRLLLSPVRLGAQALSSVVGGREPNKIGLPTAPSSTSVQDRVLQAAAKHESQPSDSEEVPEVSPELTPQTGKNLDLSEA